MTQINNSISKTILIMAGGTGGHVYPAIAVAKHLQSQSYRIVWLGNENSFESAAVQRAGFEIEYLQISAFRGKNILAKITVPFRLAFAIYQAAKIIKKIKPISALGMGGYVAGPGAIACKLLSVPLIIHEQNSIPGLTNRLLSYIATFVLVAFPTTFNNKKNKVFTGNPVRQEILNLPNPELRFVEHSGNLRILILGGSLGAKYLNDSVPDSISKLKSNLSIDIWHQTGKGKYSDTLAAYSRNNISAKVDEYIFEMHEAYLWADIVICRAGAMTVSELIAVGLGAILIPYPFAVDDHQTSNANYLVNANAAILAPQNDLSITHLTSLLNNILMKGRSYLLTMANNAYSLAKKDATLRIANICVEAVGV